MSTILHPSIVGKRNFSQYTKEVELPSHVEEDFETQIAELEEDVDALEFAYDLLISTTDEFNNLALATGESSFVNIFFIGSKQQIWSSASYFSFGGDSSQLNFRKSKLYGSSLESLYFVGSGSSYSEKPMFTFSTYISNLGYSYHHNNSMNKSYTPSGHSNSLTSSSANIRNLSNNFFIGTSIVCESITCSNLDCVLIEVTEHSVETLVSTELTVTGILSLSTPLLLQEGEETRSFFFNYGDSFSLHYDHAARPIPLFVKMYRLTFDSYSADTNIPITLKITVTTTLESFKSGVSYHQVFYSAVFIATIWVCRSNDYTLWGLGSYHNTFENKTTTTSLQNNENPYFYFLMENLVFDDSSLTNQRMIWVNLIQEEWKAGGAIDYDIRPINFGFGRNVCAFHFSSTSTNNLDFFISQNDIVRLLTVPSGPSLYSDITKTQVDFQIDAINTHSNSKFIEVTKTSRTFEYPL